MLLQFQRYLQVTSSLFFGSHLVKELESSLELLELFSQLVVHVSSLAEFLVQLTTNLYMHTHTYKQTN